VERDALDLMSGGEEGGGSLELAVVPTFATQWLLPRLGDFQRQHPGITLHFTPRTRPFLFTDTPFDAAILPGSEPWPGTESIDLLPEPLVAVASRACPARRPAARPRTWPGSRCCRPAPGRTAGGSGSPRWGWRWSTTWPGRAWSCSPCCPRRRAGAGRGLVPRLLVESDLASGRLVVVLPHPHASGRSYRLIYPPHKADGPLLQALAGWLTGQAQPTRPRRSAAPRPGQPGWCQRCAASSRPPAPAKKPPVALFRRRAPRGVVMKRRSWRPPAP
jgi:LysR family glycine cleavage system transcriptional activator